MIEIDNLVKKYGEHVAVDHLSLTVEPGKIYGFLGPNGAGKSTTMNIITGYLGATSGTVTINGHDIFKEPEEAKKCVGYLPEIPPLYTDMTVLEYLNFVAELKKLEKGLRKRYVEEAMETTGILDVKNRMIRNLSKGYRQRVGFAQAILGYPEIIILDEPTVGLDPKQILEIRELIRKLGETKTVIISSHILAEISAVCDCVMIISHGKLVACDSIAHLEESANSENKLMLTVKGDDEKTESALIGVKGIESVVKTGKNRFEVTFADGADAREEIFFAMADIRQPIISMEYEQVTLENIFLRLTEEHGIIPSEKTDADDGDGADDEGSSDNNEKENGSDSDYTPLFGGSAEAGKDEEEAK